MEIDELKQAWHSLGQQLERQEILSRRLITDRNLEHVRTNLRPLLWGQALQLLLGIAVTVLGVTCWTRNLQAPGLLAAGILLHAFGVLTAVMAGLTIGLAASVDYDAPVLRIQKRLALLLKFQALNSAICGAPWWIMWIPVVVAVSGIGDATPHDGFPAWIAISLGIGVVGLIGTWIWGVRSLRQAARNPSAPHRKVADGSDGIRRGQALLEEIARFEREA